MEFADLKMNVLIWTAMTMNFVMTINALKNVEIFDNVQYEPIALMEGVEDINASKTETALLRVEK